MIIVTLLRLPGQATVMVVVTDVKYSLPYYFLSEDIISPSFHLIYMCLKPTLTGELHRLSFFLLFLFS